MWNVYPRPQLKRDSFLNLNGTWLVNGKETYVPSCLYEEHLVYEREFSFVKENDRALLHIGAADQIAKVYLNDNFVGEHKGGYLPFDFDVTDFVKEGINHLRIEVIDTLDKNFPYGKQKKNHSGMWYTPTSGIWKSVWIEQVPNVYIDQVKITPDLMGADVTLFINDCTAWPDVKTQCETIRFDEDCPNLWTPDNPHLYYKTIEFCNDKVVVYYALRTVEILPDENGINRVCLNGKSIFLHGILDQGYYCDTNNQLSGTLIPKTPEEYDKDILKMKELGFNLLRKHIKVEPEEFYFACDRLGILVMQDMVNSGEYNFFKDTVLGTLGIKFNDKVTAYDERENFWIEHTKQTIFHLYNHPCIIAYTLFNEGWGQFDSDKIYALAKACDSTRLIDSTSGWFAQSLSDFDSLHVYFRTKKLTPQKRPMLLSECGGFTLNLTDASKTYGYGKCKTIEELTDRIIDMYEEMIAPAIEIGLCGSIYTQLSDVEEEINGLYTFDRTICKVNKDKMKSLAEKLYDKVIVSNASDFEMNGKVKLKPEAVEFSGRKACMCDVVWEDKKVVAEYESNLVHLDKGQHEYDKRRSTAIMNAGYKIINITARDVGILSRADEIFLLIKKALGIRNDKQRLKNFEDVRYEVFQNVFKKDIFQILKEYNQK